jgi:hypothetical protein
LTNLNPIRFDGEGSRYITGTLRKPKALPFRSGCGLALLSSKKLQRSNVAQAFFCAVVFLGGRAGPW